MSNPFSFLVRSIFIHAEDHYYPRGNWIRSYGWIFALLGLLLLYSVQRLPPKRVFINDMDAPHAVKGKSHSSLKPDRTAHRTIAKKPPSTTHRNAVHKPE
ncbi:MAG: hypothetical protein SGJ27_03655 [Candidatus Melainabacteria bacterium]|nr:hypothetical protein [Candidatus Melainabacteria bacterium]